MHDLIRFIISVVLYFSTGHLVLSGVSRALLAPLDKCNRVVYEAIIVSKENFDYNGRGRDHIYLCLSTRSAASFWKGLLLLIVNVKDNNGGKQFVRGCSTGAAVGGSNCTFTMRLSFSKSFTAFHFILQAVYKPINEVQSCYDI